MTVECCSHVSEPYFFRNSLVKLLPHSLVSCSTFFLAFRFTAFNIVTNIVYKSINFAMCQFMRFSAAQFRLYNMLIYLYNTIINVVLFWLFGWNGFYKCIRRYSINFMFKAYCLIILVVYTWITTHIIPHSIQYNM